MKRTIVALCALMAAAGCMRNEPASRAEPVPFTVAPAHSSAAQIGYALNRERVARGLQPLSYNPRLAAAAMGHARDMSRHQYFSHRSRNGMSHMRRVTRQGYDACLAAENIAHGYRSVDTVMDGWMKSPGHRRNNLLRKAQEYGAAYVPEGRYWVLVFGRRCSS